MTEHEKHRRDVHTSFAAAALTGLLASPEFLMKIDGDQPDTPTRVVATNYSFAQADTMMEEWDKRNPAPPADGPVVSDGEFTYSDSPPGASTSELVRDCKDALWHYHNALDRRMDGNTAAAMLAARLECIFSTPWVQGATL